MAGADDMDRAALEAGYVCVGALRGAHGVKGLTKVASFMEEGDTLFQHDPLFLGPAFEPVSLSAAGRAGDLFLAKTDRIASREEAQRLKGARLFLPRSAMTAPEEDAFYQADLIGLVALDTAGEKLGHVRSVEDFGAGDLLEITLDAPQKGLGRHVFIPFTKLLVPDVSPSKGHVSVNFALWLQDQVIASPDDGSKP